LARRRRRHVGEPRKPRQFSLDDYLHRWLDNFTKEGVPENAQEKFEKLYDEMTKENKKRRMKVIG